MLTLSAKEAVDLAIDKLKEPGDGYIVINETSDNPVAARLAMAQDY